MNGDSVHY